MQRQFLQRAISLCLSAVVTLAVLGSIHGLSLHEESSARWAVSMCAAPRA